MYDLAILHIPIHIRFICKKITAKRDVILPVWIIIKENCMNIVHREYASRHLQYACVITDTKLEEFFSRYNPYLFAPMLISLRTFLTVG